MIPFVLITAAGCEQEKEGCTDPMSIKYDPDAEKDDGTCTYAGAGGYTEMTFLPKIDTTSVISQPTFRDTAYVKFNSKTFPGTDPAAYDLIHVGEIGEDHIHFYGMKPGYYYVYVVGMNTENNQKVSGHQAVTLTPVEGVVHVEVQMQ